MAACLSSQSCTGSGLCYHVITVVGGTMRHAKLTSAERALRHALDSGLTRWLVQVRDMSLNEQDGKLVACSCNNSFVGVWVVELNKVKPFSGPAVRPAPPERGSCYVLFVLSLSVCFPFLGGVDGEGFCRNRGRSPPASHGLCPYYTVCLGVVC